LCVALDARTRRREPRHCIHRGERNRARLIGLSRSAAPRRSDQRRHGAHRALQGLEVPEAEAARLATVCDDLERSVPRLIAEAERA
jgi:hypothetical protein